MNLGSEVTAICSMVQERAGRKASEATKLCQSLGEEVARADSRGLADSEQVERVEEALRLLWKLVPSADRSKGVPAVRDAMLRLREGMRRLAVVTTSCHGPLESEAQFRLFSYLFANGAPSDRHRLVRLGNLAVPELRELRDRVVAKLIDDERLELLTRYHELLGRSMVESESEVACTVVGQELAKVAARLDLLDGERHAQSVQDFGSPSASMARFQERLTRIEALLRGISGQDDCGGADQPRMDPT